MKIEGLGVVIVLLGLIGWVARPSFAVYVLFVATLLGASATVILTSLGGANIMPADLLLGFLALSSLVRRDHLVAAPSLTFPNEGFWLALTALYAVVTAILLPRLFAGKIEVLPIARLEAGGGIVLTPLAPSSANITQTVYFLGDVVCFFIIYARASRPGGIETVARAGLLCAAVNLFFAVADLVTYATHTEAALGFIRNANYRMLDDAAIIGFKRIVGSFPEASSFAYATVGLFAFCARLYIARIHPRLTGALALLSLCALVFATSSTGYFGTAMVLAGLYLLSLWHVLTRPVPKAVVAIVVLTPLALAAALIALRLDTPVWGVITDMINETVTGKLQSPSGEERAMWNAWATRVFDATNGLGVGTGSLRASSFPVAVLSQIGVIGAIAYGAFLCGVMFRRKGRFTAPFSAACQSAARWACVALVAAGSASGSFIDLGLPFFIFAGLACARPMARRAAAPSRSPISRSPASRSAAAGAIGASRPLPETL